MQYGHWTVSKTSKTHQNTLCAKMGWYILHTSNHMMAWLRALRCLLRPIQHHLCPLQWDHSWWWAVAWQLLVGKPCQRILNAFSCGQWNNWTTSDCYPRRYTSGLCDFCYKAGMQPHWITATRSALDPRRANGSRSRQDLPPDRSGCQKKIPLKQLRWGSGLCDNCYNKSSHFESMKLEFE